MLSLRQVFARTNTPLSKRATARKFPEEWAWWRASGWEMLAHDAEDGRLVLFTSQQKPNGSIRSWGAQASAEEVATSEQVRHFLTISLYLHLHPRKASQHYVATGTVGTEAELAAFVRQQRRKVAALAGPTPTS
jgi:hypothetical protein